MSNYMNTQNTHTNEELATAAVLDYSIAANDNGMYIYLTDMLQVRFGERVGAEELVEAMETAMRTFIEEKLDETNGEAEIDFKDIVIEQGQMRDTDSMRFFIYRELMQPIGEGHLNLKTNMCHVTLDETNDDLEDFIVDGIEANGFDFNN